MSLTPAVQTADPRPEVTLRDYLAILSRRRVVFLQVFLMVLTAGIVLTLASRPVYRATARLLASSRSGAVNLIDTSNPIATILAASQPENVATQIEIMRSEPFQEEARRGAGLKAEAAGEPLLVDIRQVEDTNIIEVAVEGGEPRRIAALANSLLDLQLRKTSEQERAGLNDALTYVKKQLEITTRQLAARDYQDILRRYHDARTAVDTTRQKLAELRGQLAREPVELVQPQPKENTRRTRLQERLDDLRLQRAELARDYRPESRRLQSLDEQIRTVEAELAELPEELSVASRVVNPARAPLLAHVAELEAELPGRKAALVSAQRELETRRPALLRTIGTGPLPSVAANREAIQRQHSELSTRRQELEIRSRATSGQLRAIERARPPLTPIRPNVALNLVLSAALALSLGLACALLQEYLDDRIATADDLERVTALPALVQIPIIPPDLPRLVTHRAPNSIMAEAFRALRSGLAFAALDHPIRTVVVTSAEKGDGKTLTAVNLAVAVAQDGKRVLLVDADMRRPESHNLLGEEHSPGLSDVLAGGHLLSEAVRNRMVPGLSFLPAGSVPPNPTGLLGSQRLGTLLQNGVERFDLIVFDSPPCLPVADALILASRVDAVALVVHSGVTRKASLRQAEKLLQRARARVVGVVVNQVVARADEYYNYYSRVTGKPPGRLSEGYPESARLPPDVELDDGPSR